VGEADFRLCNLTNKLWNAARFCIGCLMADDGDRRDKVGIKDDEFTLKLAKLHQKISKNFQKLQLGLAAETTYNEFWHWYCDEIIELAKTGEISQPILLKGLITFLKLLHPFMPFVTEAIWQQLKLQNLVDEPLLITSRW
jgi:valyl-tRNA synthetase